MVRAFSTDHHILGHAELPNTNRRAYGMGMPNSRSPWTRADVLAIPPDGSRYELVDGQLLVTPAPRGVHQRAVGQLFLLLAPFVERHRLGGTYFSPADLDLGAGHLVQPDLFVAPLVNGREPIDWAEIAVPLLIAEVVSPTTAQSDRSLKRRRFQRSGVAEYWIVDVDARRVERWRPEDPRAEVLTERLVWTPVPGEPALVIDLDRYFARVWAEA